MSTCVLTNDFKALLRMRTVTGLVGLGTEGDNNRASDAIEIDDDYVQGLIKADESEHAARSFGVDIGSFVRMMDSYVRDFCGYVTKRHGDRTSTETTENTRFLASTDVLG